MSISPSTQSDSDSTGSSAPDRVDVASYLERERLPAPCAGIEGQAGEAVLLLDPKDHVSGTSADAAALLGIPGDDLVGRPAASLPILHRTEAKAVWERQPDDGPAWGVVEQPPAGRFHLRVYPGEKATAVYLSATSSPTPSARQSEPAENAAVEAERERLQMALDGADLGAWELCFETGETIYSERWAEMLGYTLDDVEHTAAFFFRHVHPEDRERVRQAAEACVRNEEAMMDLVIRMRHKDGSWRWILDRGRIFEWDANGLPVRMVGTHMDVTDRKRDQMALRRERDLLERVFEASPTPIVVLNADGEMVRISKRAREVLGIGPDDAQGRRFNDPGWGIEAPGGGEVSDDDLPFSRIMTEARPVYDVEHRVRWPDGTSRLLSVSGAPLFADVGPAGSNEAPAPDASSPKATASNGSPRGAVFVLTDVTEARRAETALQRSEERFRAVAEQAVDVIAIFEADGTFHYLSPSVERVTGFPREQLVGTDGFAPVHPDDVADLRGAFEQALHDEEAMVEAEGRYRHRDGTWRLLSIRGRRIESKTGEPQVLANVRDVTGRRKRQRELVEARDKAEEASRLKSAMLANMSHEIRTPLTSIIGFAEMLGDAGLDDPHDNFVRLIYNSSRRLVTTLSSVLDLSRLEAGAINASATRVDVKDLVRDVTDEIGGQARRAEVEVLVDDGVRRANTDPEVLRQILVNLLSNAIKFTGEGGEVTVRTRRPKGSESSDRLVLAVEDTGIGMDPDFAEQAFDAFTQESTGAARTYEGSGLGLALVRRYVELLGGTVQIHTEKGVGTTVTVRL